jgi:hypothetical protein
MELAQVSIEYMIMIPVLILQIFLFPMVASTIMNNWVDSRRTIAIQEAASNLSSSLQQLYSSLNHNTISTGKVTILLDLPGYIEDYAYNGTGVLRETSSGGSRVLEITLKYVGIGISTTALATFGNNTEWVPDSTFSSNSTAPSITGEKYLNSSTGLDMIKLSFTSG